MKKSDILYVTIPCYNEEEVIRETIHDVPTICSLLEKCGFNLLRCADRMLDDGGHGTTWFIIAAKS